MLIFGTLRNQRVKGQLQMTVEKVYDFLVRIKITWIAYLTSMPYMLLLLLQTQTETKVINHIKLQLWMRV